MKYILVFLFVLSSVFSFSQTTEKNSLIKGVISSFETNSLKKIENFTKANGFHFKDKSSEDDKDFISTYMNDANGETITVNIKQGKVAILTYSLNDQQNYNNAKDEISQLGFESNKPNENLAKGIVEEVNYQKSKIAVMASYRKGKSNVAASNYSFTITSGF